MNRANLRRSLYGVRRIRPQITSLGGSPFSGWHRWILRSLLVLFFVNFALVCLRIVRPQVVLPDARWPEGTLLVITTAVLIASLARQLPLQNLMLACSIIALIAGAVHSLGALTAIPFGPYTYTTHVGQQLFYPLPWAVPLIWITFILASRGVARLILRPWRKTNNYGIRLMASTILLVLLLDLGLEPFALHVKHYWYWNPTKLPLNWYGTPAINFFGWISTTVLILGFITPSLINKKPGPPGRPDYLPLVVWVLLEALFAGGGATLSLWFPMSLLSVGSLVITTLALWGARN